MADMAEKEQAKGRELFWAAGIIAALALVGYGIEGDFGA
jgi:hypothetical protein